MRIEPSCNEQRNKKEKKLFWEPNCKQINRYMGSRRVWNAWKTIKKCINLRDIKDSSNITLIKINARENHYQKLLKEGRPKFMTTSIPEEENSRDTIEEISVTELKTAVKYMKNGKVAGPGNIPIELVNYGPDILLEKLVEVYNKCLLGGNNIPNDRKIGNLSSLQTKGNKKICSN